MRSYAIKYIVVFSLLISVFGCVEPFDIETENLESALVIEATITNEYKKQEIKLSRTYALGDEGPNPESGAQVKVVNLSGDLYQFQEEEPGVYRSSQEFSAENNSSSYQLEVITSDGKTYASEPVKLDASSEIMEMDIVKSTQPINGVEKEGLALTVNSGENDSKFYRYTYQETYEFRSLYRIPFKFILENGVIDTAPKTEEEYLCYVTRDSESIIISSSSNIVNEAVSDFPVRFLSKENPAISYRYSLLVKQYSLSREAYTFYEVLNELSGSESLFSQNQPGFVNGNVFSVDNPNEKVLGYFSVSAVDSHRVFFNFTDFYDRTERPPYPYNCTITRPEYPVLLNAVENDAVSLISQANGGADSEGMGPYRVVPKPCVDCRVFGVNVKPDFWED
ncbi:DUF4249 family protein [Salegentibacter sp. BLCTC]|uniref:DUF4249 domain-containing protein n=1 Tax=Salegentibacter sp. BLCTC TaxID=2697368 RepID=UPI00187B6447|nr:DUF4249 domain-containing protein [Salegentibacter sp. BLCTC]MBE7641240.1 DUF4249 family protein [Salegentibacter sp. BLCTC]